MKRGILKKISLPGWIFISIILGVAAGLLLKERIYSFSATIGDIFLNLLKMITLPLIFTSISTGVISVGGSKNLGRVGLKTILYYILSSLVAIVTGLLLTNTIKPGADTSFFTSSVESSSVDIQSLSIRDIILKIFTPNIFNSFAQGEMLPVIFFSLLIGFFVTRLRKKQRLLLSDILQAGFELMMKITGFILKLAPVGIFP